MANIHTYLENILSSIYGKDVRQSIHDGIEKINEEVELNSEAESERVHQEQLRKQAEIERNNAEISRGQAEGKREQTKAMMESIITDMNDKIANDYYRGPQGIQGVGIGLSPKGEWESGIYVLNDWVVHNGAYWWCKVDETQEEPMEENSDWEKLYEMSAEMPIKFDEPEKNSSTFLETLSNIASGQTLGNLFKYIKGSFLKLLKKFGDTEYTATGTSITYDTSNDSSVMISNFGTSTNDFHIIAENEGENEIGLSNSSITGFSVDGANNIITIDGYWALTGRSVTGQSIDPGTYILKMIPLSGSLGGKVTIHYELKEDASDTFVEYVALTSDNIQNVEFSVNEINILGRIRVVGDFASGTTANKYAFMVVVCKKDTEYKANGALVEVANIKDKYTLYSYEGKTKIFTTSLEQVTFKAEFKTRFWHLQNKKIDKANIAHNLATTNPDMVLGADMGKALNDRLDSISGIGETGMTDSGAGSVQAATWTTIQSVTLPKGVYKLVGKMQVPPSGTGAAFAIRFTFEPEYVSQVYHSVIGMAVEKVSYVAIGDTPTTINLAGYSTIVSNFGSARIRWEKISNG